MRTRPGSSRNVCSARYRNGESGTRCACVSRIASCSIASIIQGAWKPKPWIATGSGGRLAGNRYSRPAKENRLPAIRLAKGTSGKQASREGLFEAMASASDGRRSGTARPSGPVQFSQATLPPSSGSSPKSKPWAERVTTSAIRLVAPSHTGDPDQLLSQAFSAPRRSGGGRGSCARLDPAPPLADHHPDHDQRQDVEHGQAHEQGLVANGGRQCANHQGEQGPPEIAGHAAKAGGRGDILLRKHVRHDGIEQA